jgi:Protein of unknown function (DUF3800)
VSGYSVYLDDSGHPVDKPYLVVGGFIAREDRWIDFEKPWRDCLRTRGIDFPFHATDFFAKHKGDPKLKHILADLVIVITNYVEAAFSVAVDVNAYKEFNRERRLEEFAGTPYALLTRALYKNVDDWQMRVGGRSPISYFVEDGTLHKGDMMDCLRDRDGINPPASVRKDNVACQAADLYAYSVYQSALLGKASESFGHFMEKLPFTNERVDTRTFRAELEAYLASNTSVVHTEKHPEGIKMPIPKRALTPNLQFNFSRNKKKIRRATVGIPKK